MDGVDQSGRGAPLRAQRQGNAALALAGGATRQAVATRRMTKPSTVQSQVHAILAKTGATNLRDFERILAGLKGA